MMRAFYQAGRRDALVRQYSLCTDLLHREEGRAPDVRTAQLYRELMAILRQPFDGAQDRAQDTAWIGNQS